jgi:hypothetical protein
MKSILVFFLLALVAYANSQVLCCHMYRNCPKTSVCRGMEDGCPSSITVGKVDPVICGYTGQSLTSDCVTTCMNAGLSAKYNETL